jgi:ABC-type Na+ efflux pump permease subunit
MRLDVVRAIALRDLRAAFRSRATTLPIFITPILFIVVMPAVIGGVIHAGIATQNQLQELSGMLERLPPELASFVRGLEDPRAQIAHLIFGVAFAPFFLLLPVMVASVIAADSFAGERERGTLESLLYTPTTDSEVFAAKCLAAWVPAVLTSLVGFVVYCAVVDAMMWSIVGGPLLPTVTWTLVALWVSPAFAGLSLGVTVIISARVSTVQAATQLSGLLVIPIITLVVMQFLGVVALSGLIAFFLGLLGWLGVGMLLAIGAGVFRRAEILAR